MFKGDSVEPSEPHWIGHCAAMIQWKSKICEKCSLLVTYRVFQQKMELFSEVELEAAMEESAVPLP